MGGRRGGLKLLAEELEADAYTAGASTGSRGPGGYGALLTWRGKTQEISGGEQQVVALAWRQFTLLIEPENRLTASRGLAFLDEAQVLGGRLPRDVQFDLA